MPSAKQDFFSTILIRLLGVTVCFKQSVVRPDYVCTYAANMKLNRCWDDAGPASETPVQLWVNVLFVCWHTCRPPGCSEMSVANRPPLMLFDNNQWSQSVDRWVHRDGQNVSVWPDNWSRKVKIVSACFSRKQIPPFCFNTEQITSLVVLIEILRVKNFKAHMYAVLNVVLVVVFYFVFFKALGP